MNLPTPTDEEVKEFAAIYLREFGIQLSPEDAWEAATITLKLFYLATYGNKTKATDMGSVPPA